ncbi:ParB/RepB/Spo0J family partition protein [Serinibacter salmoneus]|uniref:Chromosome segregation DNA-binding protein n=1 Tax=Serinibacter salmoneus TaxID=556530 RepID=A0A2A9D5C9_9MICO|nr:ParB/RepB/Spo0J family partition protein [Serinibacter salmoneus]PFG21162.1 chromosome segregation DNA-binding protein [Serinibacter salmoneus]
MSDKRRTGLGRGLGALIPNGPATNRPVDVFFPRTVAAPSETATDGPTKVVESSDGTTSQDSSAQAAVAGHYPATDLTTDRARRLDGVGPEHYEAANADLRSAVDTESEGIALSHAPIEHPAPRRSPDDVRENQTVELAPVPGASFAELPLDSIVPNPHQPRTVFDEDDLAELAASIREVGVLQPVVVRAGATGYELIMGERRWRASRLAGATTVPAIIRETTDTDLLRDALLENLHRAQLNPLEEAAAYAQLLEDFGCTHEELARRIARSRPQISNTLRLLRLPPAVQRRVAAGVLSSGHARALLGLTDPTSMENLAHRIVAEGLSVRATEEIVALGDDDPVRPELRRRPRVGAHTEALAGLGRRLSDRWDTKVQVNLGQRKGKISIEFANLDDLTRIMDALAPEETQRLNQDTGA